MTAYTLFSQTGGGTLQADATAYTMAVQFSVSQSATLTAIWFYSATGAGNLPATIALYAVTGTSLVASQAASWTGAGQGGGWNRAAFDAPPSLTADTQYKACVYDDASGATVNWYSLTASYWSSGAGSGGITNGPLTAPNDGASSPGQGSFNSGAGLAYPGSTFSASNYWVDPEITVSGGGGPNVVQSSTPDAAAVSGWIMLPVRGRAGSAV